MTPEQIHQMTDAELQRWIGERHGFYVYEITYTNGTHGYIPVDSNGELYINGRIHTGGFNPEKTQEKAWRHAPNWPQCADDALGLLRETDYALWPNGDEWEVLDIGNGKRGDGWGHGFSIPLIAHHQSAPRAISEAYALWQLAQDARADSGDDSTSTAHDG